MPSTLVSALAAGSTFYLGFLAAWLKAPAPQQQVHVAIPIPSLSLCICVRISGSVLGLRTSCTIKHLSSAILLGGCGCHCVSGLAMMTNSLSKQSIRSELYEISKIEPPTIFEVTNALYILQPRSGRVAHILSSAFSAHDFAEHLRQCP